MKVIKWVVKGGVPAACLCEQRLRVSCLSCSRSCFGSHDVHFWASLAYHSLVLQVKSMNMIFCCKWPEWHRAVWQNQENDDSNTSVGWATPMKKVSAQVTTKNRNH
jgi:hypothetical protein